MELQGGMTDTSSTKLYGVLTETRAIPQGWLVLMEYFLQWPKTRRIVIAQLHKRASVDCQCNCTDAGS